jgi:hypothetical protein
MARVASSTHPLHCVNAVRWKTCPSLEAFAVSFSQQRIFDLLESVPPRSSLLVYTSLDAETRYHHVIDLKMNLSDPSVSWFCYPLSEHKWKGTFARYLNALQMQMHMRFDSKTWDMKPDGRGREVVQGSSQLRMVQMVWWLLLHRGYQWEKSTLWSSTSLQRDAWVQQLQVLWQEIGVDPEQEFPSSTPAIHF